MNSRTWLSRRRYLQNRHGRSGPAQCGAHHMRNWGTGAQQRLLGGGCAAACATQPVAHLGRADMSGTTRAAGA
eukprot:15439024-Alexandrium_andersonii.AAC.1